MPRPARAILFCLAATAVPAVLVLAAELLARRLSNRPHLPHAAIVSEKGAYQAVEHRKGPRGVATPARMTTNRWGMRGGDPPRDWEAWDTWVATGSSTTLCYALDDTSAWPARLESRLRAARPRTWVGNAGQDGATSLSISALADSLAAPMRPRGLLYMASVNDMVLSLSDERRRKGSSYDRALLGRIARMQQARARDASGWFASLKAGSRLLDERRARRRRAAREWLVLREEVHRSYFPPPLAGPEDALPPLPVLLPSLPAFRANLVRIGERAREAGIRPVFLTEPLLHGSDSAWAARQGRTVRVEGREYRISAATERGLLDRFNAGMLEVCAERRWECLDLAARMPSDSLLFYDEGHFTDAGADLAAEVIAGYLLGP